MILVEDQRGSLPVVLKGMTDGIVASVNTWHDDEERKKKIDDGRKCLVIVL